MTPAEAIATCQRYEQCGDCPYFLDSTIDTTCPECGQEIEDYDSGVDDKCECLLEIDGIEPYLWHLKLGE